MSSICASCAMKSKPKGYSEIFGVVRAVAKPFPPVCQDANSINYTRRCSHIRKCEDYRLVAYSFERERVEPVGHP